MFNAPVRSATSPFDAHPYASQPSAPAHSSERLALALNAIAASLDPSSEQHHPRSALNQKNLPDYLNAVLGLRHDESAVNPSFRSYAQEISPPSSHNTLPDSVPRDATLLAASLVVRVYSHYALNYGRLDRDFFFATLSFHTGQPEDALRRSIQADDLDGIAGHNVASNGAIEVTLLPELQVSVPPAAGVEPPAGLVVRSRLIGTSATSTPAGGTDSSALFDLIQDIAVANADTRLSSQNEATLPSWQTCWQNDDASNFAEHLDHDPAMAPPSAHTWLHEASATEKPHILDMLLARKLCDVNVQRADGRTPLHLACAACELKAVRQILMAGADLNMQDTKGITPLMLACQYRHPRVIAELMRHDTLNIGLPDHGQRTALHWAAASGMDAVVSGLLKRGADALARDVCKQSALDLARQGGYSNVITQLERHLESKLHGAATQGDISALLQLLSRGVDVNAQNGEGSTALHLAASGGHRDAIRSLLANGAQVGISDQSGRTALHVAARKGHHPLVTLLIGHGANINAASEARETALHLSARYGYGDVVQVLLDQQADIHATNEVGNTALHVAASEGCLSVVTLLLDRQANVHAASHRGHTALHCAADYGQAEGVELLLSHQADIHAVDQHGQTPLHLASIEGHTDVVNVFLRNRADIHATDQNGQTPLHVAAREGDAGVARLLLAHQARIHAVTHTGHTPLHLAAREGHLDVIKLLLTSKANVNVADDHGLTPLHFAARFGYINTTKLLLSNKANIDARDKAGKTALDYATTPAIQALLTDKAHSIPPRTRATRRTTTTSKELSSSSISVVEHSTRKHSRARVEGRGTAASIPHGVPPPALSRTTSAEAGTSPKATAAQPLPSLEKTSRTQVLQEKKPSHADVLGGSTLSGSHVAEKTPQPRKELGKARVPVEDRQG